MFNFLKPKSPEVKAAELYEAELVKRGKQFQDAPLAHQAAAIKSLDAAEEARKKGDSKLFLAHIHQVISNGG